MAVIKRLAGYLGPYWKTLILTCTLLVLNIAFSLLGPLFQRQIIDQVIGHQALGNLLILVAGLIAVYAIAGLTEFGDQYLRHTLGERFICDLRVRLYGRLQRLSLSYFEHTSTGELMSRVTNDVNALEQFVTHGVVLTAIDGLRLLGSAVVLLVLDWRLALVAFVPIPIVVYGLRRYNRRARPIYRAVRRRLADINAKLQDNLAGIRVVQAFGQETTELNRFSAVSEHYYRERVGVIRAWSTFFPALSFVSWAGGALLLGAGAYMVVKGQTSLGTLVAFLSYSDFLYSPLRRLTEVDNILQEAIAAGERIFDMMDEVPDIKDAPDALALERIQGDVVFEDVHFRYDPERVRGRR